MKKGYVNIPEGQIHYRTEGSGPPLLLFHMAPMSSEEFNDLIPLLSGKYQVVAPDLPGHGESSDPPHEYAVAEYSRAILAFMDALRIRKAHLAGNHTGSTVALYLATEHPDRVERLIVSGENLMPREKVQEAIDAFKKTPMLRDMPMDEEGKFLQTAWVVYRSLLAPGAPLPTRFRPFIIGLKSRLHGYDAHLAAYNAMLEGRLARVKQPMLIFSGDKDLYFNRKDLEEAAVKYHCQVAVIQGASIMSMWEKPAEVARAFLDFLSG
jgi:pimeloyl-ACP methyl ester carboxylesterase